MSCTLTVFWFFLLLSSVSVVRSADVQSRKYRSARPTAKSKPCSVSEPRPIKCALGAVQARALHRACPPSLPALPPTANHRPPAAMFCDLGASLGCPTSSCWCCSSPSLASPPEAGSACRSASHEPPSRSRARSKLDGASATRSLSEAPAALAASSTALVANATSSDAEYRGIFRSLRRGAPKGHEHK